MNNGKDVQARARLRLAVGIVIAVGFMTSLSICCYAVASQARPALPPNEMPGVLLTAASLALFALSFLVAVGAVFGWREINIRISDEITHQVGAIREEQLGYSKMITGHFFAELCLERTDDALTVKSEPYLEMAIDTTEAALESLKGTPLEIVVLNNLAFYYALGKQPKHGAKAVEYVAELRKHVGGKYGDALVTTYLAVVSAYPDSFPNPYNSLVEADDIATHFIKSKRVTQLEMENARRHQIGIRRAIERIRKDDAAMFGAQDSRPDVQA